MVDQIVSDLLNAKAYLLLHGWHQGDYAPKPSLPWKGQPVCATGALMLAVDPNQRSTWVADAELCKRFNAAMRVMASVIPDTSLVGFNDSPERTIEEVIGAFDRAIEKRRSDVGFIDSHRRNH